MKRHDNAALFRYRNDTFQEIFNVFPKSFFSYFTIGTDQFTDFILCIAGIPPRKMNIVF